MDLPSQRTANEPDGYRPHVVVRLRARWVEEQPDDYDLHPTIEKYIGGLGTVSPPASSEPRDREVWRQLRSMIPGFRFEPVLARSLYEALRRRLAAAGRSSTLRQYLTFASPDGVKPHELAVLVKELSFVEDAYVDPPASDPQMLGSCAPAALPPPQDLHILKQKYLTAAPTGIDAALLRDYWPGAPTSLPGAGVRVVDVEQGWTLNHEDLPPGIPQFGQLRDSSRPHGTAVLGAICAVPNALGCIGIAPGASVSVVSHWNRSKGAAIAEAINLLQAGDVLLLEIHVFPTVIVNPSPGGTGPEQRDDIPLPVEASPLERQLIEDAIALDIVVVETAGNASLDLDTVFDLSSNPVFSQDSGAIVVGAGTSAVPHARLPSSNFGTAVSCYAWGENVTTCWWDANDATKLYTHNFSNTSAAAAIIAGAAAAVQSFAVQRTGKVLKPAALRQLLTTAGTPCANPGVDKIGVMPDLRQAVLTLCGAGAPTPLVPTPAAPTNLRLDR